MQKNKIQLKKRQAFAALALENPKKAAEYIRLAAFSLDQCRTSEEIIFILSETLFLSFSTIEKDIKNYVKT